MARSCWICFTIFLGSVALHTGEVRDEAGPLAGARVRIKGTNECTLTDARGQFTIRKPKSANREARVTAWKKGYFISGIPLEQNPLLLQLHRLPDKDNAKYAWVEPASDPKGKHNCANCHGKIYDEWSQSSHAHSATGRHFVNLYAGTDWKGKKGIGWSLLDEKPDGSGVCTSCHAPTVPIGDPALFDLTKIRGVASRGVHCDYCHKVSGLNEGDTLGLSHGRDILTLLRPAEGQLFFGPLDDVDRGEDTFSPFYKDSRYCASCHEGVVFGVPVYTTYSEWRESPAARRGQHCQDCHMKPTGKMTNIAPGKGGIERDPWTLGNHRFFEESKEAMLRKCVKVSGRLKRDGDQVKVEVSLRTEGVGHRVPTGFIDRHLLVIVEGLDEKGQIVSAEKGPLLPSMAGPTYKGKSGRLYAKWLIDEKGHSPIPFWRIHLQMEDTRLRPGETDQLELQFPPKVQRVRVQVIYRRFWEDVSQTKGWPNEDMVVAERVFP